MPLARSFLEIITSNRAWRWNAFFIRNEVIYLRNIIHTYLIFINIEAQREGGMKALLLDSDVFNYFIIINSHRVS